MVALWNPRDQSLLFRLLLYNFKLQSRKAEQKLANSKLEERNRTFYDFGADKQGSPHATCFLWGKANRRKKGWNEQRSNISRILYTEADFITSWRATKCALPFCQSFISARNVSNVAMVRGVSGWKAFVPYSRARRQCIMTPVYALVFVIITDQTQTFVHTRQEVFFFMTNHHS